ncbi:MAG: ribonuclease R [Bacteroidota bacterium]|nr:ribonuclease R [Bacteroidota bacterium]
MAKSKKQDRRDKTRINKDKGAGNIPKLHRKMKSEILNALRTFSSQPFTYKQLAANMDLHSHEDRDMLSQILEELVTEGHLESPEIGKFKMQNASMYVTGRVDATKTGGAYIVVDNAEEEDVMIMPARMKQALHGDTVKVLIYARKAGKKPEGEIVEVLERNRTEFTGILQVHDRFNFLIPDNKRISVDIFIPHGKLNGGKNGDKALVKIIDWPQDSKSPIGQVVKVLGRPGEHNAEMNAIIAEFQLPEEFPAHIIREANDIQEDFSPAEVKKRRDMRTTMTFTIDPADAKDFDDAISYKELENGNTEVGVHIADVSHYVKEGTLLDAEALNRATSVYLVDRVIPMLPERLSNELCSLRPDEEKMTFSVIVELDNEANVVGQWLGRTVIKSHKRFSYEDAQEILEGKESEYSIALLRLNMLAYKMRELRFSLGAISFETEEVKFLLDSVGKPTGVYKKVRKDAHKLIEDYMLLANRTVATYMYKARGRKDSNSERPFIYRVHDNPDEKKVATFAALAAQFGYKLNFKSPKTVAKSISKVLTDAEGKPEHNMLSTLAIRTMSKAIYTTAKTSHYGLAFDFYTHFTSPIRRYPDVIAHRLLADQLAKVTGSDAEAIEAMAKHSTEMEIRAAEAERASIKYKQVEFMTEHVGESFEGIISGVTDWGIFVEIIENKCEGMVRISYLKDDNYVYEEELFRIRGLNSGRTYSLGDKLYVVVEEANLMSRTIDFSFADADSYYDSSKAGNKGKKR